MTFHVSASELEESKLDFSTPSDLDRLEFSSISISNKITQIFGRISDKNLVDNDIIEEPPTPQLQSSSRSLNFISDEIQ